MTETGPGRGCESTTSGSTYSAASPRTIRPRRRTYEQRVAEGQGTPHGGEQTPGKILGDADVPDGVLRLAVVPENRLAPDYGEGALYADDPLAADLEMVPAFLLSAVCSTAAAVRSLYAVIEKVVAFPRHRRSPSTRLERASGG